MTIAFAIILAGVLLIYAGVKGKSLSSLLMGKSVDATSGSLISSGSSK